MTEAEKEHLRYIEHLKLESNYRIIIPDNISDEEKKKLKLLNSDPFSYFLKYDLLPKEED